MTTSLYDRDTRRIVLSKGELMGRFEFFKSRNVSWKPGIHLKRARWHSCMQWGWPAIHAGEHLARYCDYWVFYICWRTYGICWHYYPKAMKS